MEKKYELIDFERHETVEVGDIFIDDDGDEMICVRPIDGGNDYTFMMTDALLCDLPSDYTEDDLLSVDMDEYEYYYCDPESMEENDWLRVVKIQKTEDDKFLDGLFS